MSHKLSDNQILWRIFQNLPITEVSKCNSVCVFWKKSSQQYFDQIPNIKEFLLKVFRKI